VIERVRRGRLRLQEIVGRTVSGLVPPAWRLPVEVDDLRDSGIEYILDFGRLQSASGHRSPCRGHSVVARPNKVRVSPRQAIIANLSTVAIIIEGGR
jgi:hypothetical protein